MRILQAFSIAVVTLGATSAYAGNQLSKPEHAK